MGSQSAYVKMMIGALLLVVCVANSVAAWKEVPATGEVHVGGKVLCQDCSQGWNEWATGGHPIKGCIVAITCMDERRKIVYYGRDETDEQGQYEISISKYIYGKQLHPELCSVRLVSSPEQACNIPTDFAGGRSGVKLDRPTFVYRDTTKFLLSPFFYTTPMCDQPDTNDHDDQGSKY